MKTSPRRHSAALSFACATFIILTTIAAPSPATSAEPHKNHADAPTTKTTESSTAKSPQSIYPLDICIVSGDKLTEMGQPIIKTYKGREVRFCCAECPAKFEADPAKYMKKLDEAISEKERPTYPTDKCIVSGDTLGGDMGKPVELVYNNHLVRFCCNDCLPTFKASPKKYLAKLDDARKKQSAEKSKSADAATTSTHHAPAE